MVIQFSGIKIWYSVFIYGLFNYTVSSPGYVVKQNNSE